MKVVVLEDERPALDQLRAALRVWDPTVRVDTVLDSVSDAVSWFRQHPAPDLVLADIRLTDGPSLEVFEKVEVGCPVVFVTAYDQFVQRSLEAGGIDYVLKPVRADRLGRALDKVLRLKRHFSLADMAPGGRERVLVRRGSEMVALATADVLRFTTEHRLVFALTVDGRRHIVDKTLTELAAELDPLQFFRIGRSDIVRVDAVQGFRSHGKGRLWLRLSGGGEAVVSAEHATAFRAWLDR